MIKLIAIVLLGIMLISIVGGLVLITYMAKIRQPRDDREHERLRLQALEELRRQAKD